MKYIQTNRSFETNIVNKKTKFLGDRLYAKNNFNKHD